MSSSDSEDEYYSYRDAIKNMDKLHEECIKKLESENIDLTNDGAIPDAATNNAARNTVSTNKTTQNNIKSDTLNDSFEDTGFLDEIIKKNTKPPPLTRGRKKKEPLKSTTITSTVPVAIRGRGAKRGRASKNNVTTSKTNNTVNTVELLNNMMGCDPSLIEEALFTLTGTRGRGRKRNRASFSLNSSVEDLLEDLLSDSFSGQGKGRARGTNRGSNGRARGGRGRGSRTVSNSPAFIPPSPLYPIYSVGNTDEYPDNSDDIPLFSKPKNQSAASDNLAQAATDTILNEEIENAEDNEPLSVKVIWKSCQVFKFTIRKYQKITQIFEEFAKQENVGVDKLLFTYNEKILTCNDTPASIDYNIAKFIDGGVVSQSVNILNYTKSKVNGINIKFQGQNKKKIELMIGKNENLSLAMTQCAERLEVPLNKLKFEFDGDMVSGSSTPQQLGLEDGDCIDVMILS